MASPSATPLLGKQEHWMPGFPTQTLSYILIAFMIIIIAHNFSPSDSSLKSVPIINPAKSFSFLKVEAKRAFQTSSKEIMTKARALYPGQPYRVDTDLGEVVMLPPALADEIRNEPKLSFGGALLQDFHGDIPGFGPAALVGKGAQLLQIVARKQLTKLLAKVTEPLSEEAAVALSINLGELSDWKEITVKDALLDIVARISSRVFLGDRLCRDEDWLRITKKYTVTLFVAAAKLRLYPLRLRKLVHWFIPECKQVRAESTEAMRIITPVIQKRQQIRQAARQSGQKVPQFNDALDWAEEEAAAKGVTYDPANFQLSLSAAAIHTTTDLLEQVILDLAQHPDYFQPLREEIVQVLQVEGWKKTSLYNMKLLDSVIKESQRMKPIGIASMRRLVEGDIQLSTGLVLKKGMRVNVDSYSMCDPNVHENPDQWDGYRFLKLRSQPGRANMTQLVATSSEHIAFGHGEHACPGRFFAANELKVALCHLLMKYDWKLAPGTDVKPIIVGTSANANPAAKVLIRKRETMEIDIDSI